eukprot:TRINITY_DN4846_c2_g1_i1.p1 TRINITY_DN4846_c2_g1~~TRINITY_DN4846_c2_g1_i1.p1  ORF type:complete len:178 (+),score=31.00 TRINITY_DN4846_c2_g1_i1:68-601(+)
MGVRGRKSARTRVVKIVGKTTKKEHKAKGCVTNIMTNLLDTSMPLKQSYGKMGIASKAGMTENEKKRLLKNIPERKLTSLPPIKEQGPTRPKHISELEHAFVDNLVSKHGLDFKAMSWDMKLNPFQHTATQLKKRVLRAIKTEKRLFPEQFKEAFGDSMDDEALDAKLKEKLDDDEW